MFIDADEWRQIAANAQIKPRVGVKGRGRAKAVSPHTALHQRLIALATGARLLGGDGGDRAEVDPVIAHSVIAGSLKKRAVVF